MFLGEDLLPLLVLAIGGAMVVGNVLAVVRPPQTRRSDEDLERAPMGRTLVMAALGLVASIWAVASLLSG